MISLGPGDEELVTFKAIDRLKKSDVICVPTKSSDGSFNKSLTHKIIQKLMKLHNFQKPLVALYSPMHYKQEDWQRQVDTILDAFQTYNSVSFVTLGDAGVYSSVYYLLDIIKYQEPEVYQKCEVVAGVTSFSQASSLVKKPLCVGDSRFEIVPLHKQEGIKTTTVYMRPKIGLDTKHIQSQGDIYTFENINYQGESITKGKVSKVSKYMTLFIDFFTKDNNGI
jgi:precorrin-2/cobalt-factor-2 C20-methyltransferase